MLISDWSSDVCSSDLKNDRIRVPVPQGTFRLRLIEGQKWHGPVRYFGSNTSYETAAELMIFAPRAGHIIDLHRRPDGNQIGRAPSELQSLMRNSYAAFCLEKKTTRHQ